VAVGRTKTSADLRGVRPGVRAAVRKNLAGRSYREKKQNPPNNRPAANALGR